MRIRTCVSVLLLLVLGLVLLAPGFAFGEAGDVILASSTDAQPPVPGDTGGVYPSISSDGRYIVFQSLSTNFPGARATVSEIYRKDVQTGELLLASSLLSGESADRGCTATLASADGRYVVFSTQATNFPGARVGVEEVYRKDLQTGALDLVSCLADGTSGTAGPGSTSATGMSADGNFIGLDSSAPNFLTGGNIGNPNRQAYRKNMTSGAMELVSCTPAGAAGTGSNPDNGSGYPSVSADGRYVSFTSKASNFIPAGGDIGQAYVKDMDDSSLDLVSCADGISYADQETYDSFISGNGNYVTFSSPATNFPGANGQDQTYRKGITGTTLEKVSCLADGTFGTSGSYPYGISTDGRYIVFYSYSANFPGVSGTYQEVFRKDMTTGTIALASSDDAGAEADSDCDLARVCVSGDGMYVAFMADATNLPGHTTDVQSYRKQMDNYAPTTTSINPTQTTAGHAAFQLTVNGTNFVNGSVVRWNGSNRITTYVSPTRLTANITAADVATAGTASVTVFNAAPGGGTSNTQTFTITNNTSPLSTWYLAEGTTAWGFSAYISIQNPNSTAVTANVTFMPTGKPNVSEKITLPARSQTTLSNDHINEKMGGAGDFSTKVQATDSSKAIAVDRTMEWNRSGAGPAGTGNATEGHSSIGVNSPSTIWYLPEGSTNWGFETWLLVQNPNSTEATCGVTYMVQGGESKSVTHKVPAHSRESFSMFDDVGNKDASIMVKSNIPVIPERAMYRYNRSEGHDSIGTTTPANNFYLAEGAVGYDSGYTTYVLVQNPLTINNPVTVSFQTANGLVEGPTLQMEPESRATVRVNDYLPANTDVSTRVIGTAGSIIAERAMYWNSWAGEACHDSIGLPAPASTFYLPDGMTGEDSETWTLVQNPNPVHVNVTVTYMLNGGGTPITLNDTIAPNSRKTYNMADKPVTAGASIMVKCNTTGRKVMVERAMYWGGRSAGTDTIGGFTD